MTTGLGPLVAYGFVLGWSVAWPPGPINAEMVRRGLAQGFRPAFCVGLGACSGDALWAIAVALGAGLFVGPEAQTALAWVSSSLLLLLAAIFLRGAWRDWQHARRRVARAKPQGIPGRGGYLLGLGMALSSPWNMAFWLAVIGRVESQSAGVGGAMIVAGSVILGAGLWCLALCGSVARLRVTFGGPVWQVGAQGATGLLMLAFAVRGLWPALSG